APPALCPTLLCELPLSGAELEPVAPGGREGRVASRRAVPARRLHRDEPASPGQEGRRLLQRARHGGAVHQGGQARGQVDAAVVHDLPGQRGAPPTPRAGLQPGQLPPHARTAGRGRAAVADEPAGKGDEDRREGDRPRPLRDLPDGGGGGAARAVRPHLGADRKASSARPSPMLTLEGRNGRQPGVELRPECVLGCRSQAERRSEVSRTPWRASRRQNTLACDVARAVSKPRDGGGPPSIWEMSGSLPAGGTLHGRDTLPSTTAGMTHSGPAEATERGETCTGCDAMHWMRRHALDATDPRGSCFSGARSTGASAPSCPPWPPSAWRWP